MPSNSDKSWQEWSHRVLEELVTLNARYEKLQEELEDKYSRLQKGVEERYDQIESKLEKTNQLLTGNGHPESGLLIRVDRLEQHGVENLNIRVDRLEQSEARRTWLMRSTIVACLASIAATITSYFRL